MDFRKKICIGQCVGPGPVVPVPGRIPGAVGYRILSAVILRQLEPAPVARTVTTPDIGTECKFVQQVIFGKNITKNTILLSGILLCTLTLGYRACSLAQGGAKVTGNVSGNNINRDDRLLSIGHPDCRTFLE